MYKKNILNNKNNKSNKNLVRQVTLIIQQSSQMFRFSFHLFFSPREERITTRGYLEIRTDCGFRMINFSIFFFCLF